MKAVVKSFFNEPAIFCGVVSAGLTGWQTALLAAGAAVPLPLAIGTTIWVGVAAVLVRQNVTPVNGR